jgi:GntR family transcriptional regulator
MITRNPSLTEQVMAHLRERILAGDFEEGRIPPETELASELGVSRTTIRDAFSRLEHQGIITRRQGAGTFVNEPGLQIKSRLEEIWSYDEVLRDHGYTPSVDLLATTTEPASAGVASDLGIEEGEPVLVMEKLFRENDRPVIHTSNRVAASLVDDSDGTGATLPIFEFLDRHCGRLLGYYLSEIVPVTLDARVAGLLDVDPGTPALCFQEIGFDQDNQAVLSARSVFRDDLLRFRLIRRKAGV